jgi:hypothetical protein
MAKLFRSIPVLTVRLTFLITKMMKLWLKSTITRWEFEVRASDPEEMYQESYDGLVNMRENSTGYNKKPVI